MMECGIEGEDFDNLVDLATNITDSAPTIRDAAEKLLTLLEVNEDDDEFLSSSEDEGVEADIAESDDDFDEPKNSRILYQLAASLAQELRCSRKHNSRSTSDLIQNMEVIQDSNHLAQYDDKITAKHANDPFMESCLSRLSPEAEENENPHASMTAWTAGWEACATETMRYLVEIEGLPTYHPTVLAMKNHLEAQRERILVQFTT